MLVRVHYTVVFVLFCFCQWTEHLFFSFRSTTSAGITNWTPGAFSTRGTKFLFPLPRALCVQPLLQAFLFFSISRYMPSDFWMDSLVMKLTKCWMSASLLASSRSMVGFLIMDLEICLAWSGGGAQMIPDALKTNLIQKSGLPLHKLCCNPILHSSSLAEMLHFCFILIHLNDVQSHFRPH